MNSKQCVSVLPYYEIDTCIQNAWLYQFELNLDHYNFFFSRMSLFGHVIYSSSNSHCHQCKSDEDKIT